jgi:hypothetical protein
MVKNYTYNINYLCKSPVCTRPVIALIIYVFYFVHILIIIIGQLCMTIESDDVKLCLLNLILLIIYLLLYFIEILVCDRLEINKNN